MGRYLKAILLVLLLFLFITFGVVNSRPVQLTYYYNILNLNVPLYGLIYFSIFVGILVGILIGMSRRLTLGKKVKSLERENRELKEKVGVEMQKPD